MAAETSSAAIGASCAVEPATVLAALICEPIRAKSRAAVSNTLDETNTNDIRKPSSVGTRR